MADFAAQRSKSRRRIGAVNVGARHVENFRLWRRLSTHHYKGAGGRASWAGNRSLVHKDHGTSARTTVCGHKHFVLVAFPPASCRLAIRAHNPDRALTARSGRSARRSGRPLRTLRAGRSRWARRSRRTRLAPLTRRPGRTGLPLRSLSAACYANGKRDGNHDTFHVHAGTLEALVRRDWFNNSNMAGIRLAGHIRAGTNFR
jgi:hypothetical protein